MKKEILNIGITGHRQDILDILKIKEKKIFLALKETLNKIKQENQGKEIIFHNGFFNGTDFYIAKYAYENNIKTIFYIPLAINERYNNNDIINKKIKKASEFYKEFYPFLPRSICDEYFKIYKSDKSIIKGVNLGFKERNFEIIENSDILLSLFDKDIGKGSGTEQTISFAKNKKIKTINLLDIIKKQSN